VERIAIEDGVVRQQGGEVTSLVPERGEEAA
jgi:hypothetical protein